MKLYILIMIGMFLLIIPTMQAAEPYFNFKFGESAKVVASCDINGVPCDPALASCNLTLRDLEGGYIVNFQPMTINYGGDINYTIATNLIPNNGEYPGKINCIQDGENKTITFIARITPTGDSRGYGLFLILSIGSLITLGAGILLENEYVGFVSGALFIITGMYAMIYGIGNLSDLYTRTIAFSSLGLGVLFEVSAGYKVVEAILQERDAAF